MNLLDTLLIALLATAGLTSPTLAETPDTKNIQAVEKNVPLAAEKNEITFNRDIRPILSNNCFACHGFDEKERKADLRLDTPEGALADLGGYRAIVPGDLANSEAWQRITSEDDDEVMPPPDSHGKLTQDQKQTVKKWIEQGAVYEKHWSFIAPQQPELPRLKGEGNEIDAFLQQRLAVEEMAPSEKASKEIQIRRVTLDLTGLPPTPEEVDAFLADSSPEAYANLVDGLLGRPTYGEHMARYWLDLARYADTHGLHLDNERSMWPYRDWVVRALNQNVAFDDFTRWQLAGDLLPDPTRDQLIASGFNRCNVTTSEGGSINEEWIHRYAVDRTSTAVEVWMGLTAGCAVCHDHKFDPLSMKDYYSLYAFFHSAADPAMDGNKIDTPPVLKLTSPEDRDRIKALDAQLATVDEKIRKAIADFDYADPAQVVETIWFDDDFQSKGKQHVTGRPKKLITKAEGPVFSGKQALTRSGEGIAQDYVQGGISLSVPAEGTIFVHCYLDPANPPEALVLQFHIGGWNHRAVWGDAEKIPWGTLGTADKLPMGPLPDTGKWVRLEVAAAKLGLKPGTKISGYAFTQFNGTVTWDRLGVSGMVDNSKDPNWSWEVWKKQNQGKRNNALPEGLRQLVRGKQPEDWSKEEARRLFEFWMGKFYKGARDVLDPLEAEKAPLVKEKQAIAKGAPITFVMADLPNPRTSFIMKRGQYDNPGERVSRNVPAFLPPLPGKPKDLDYNRLDLANWLVSGNHPLTARVAVNRLWQQLFGTGLVKTSADFGSQGEPPSHPGLLAWLAVRFVEDGWDMKKTVKRIVMSHAYRQSSRVTPEALETDPENRLLARGPRFRLDAEVLRDQALFVSGLLVDKMGGKGVKPYQPPNIWEPVGFGNSNTRYYKQDKDDALYRRSLYTFIKRTAPPPFMSTFDAPNREQSCTVRGASNTPLQALQLMNDIQHVEVARNFAQRMLTEGGATDEERLKWGWQVVAARSPENEELAIVKSTLAQHRRRYASDAKAAKDLVSYGESMADESIPKTELAAYTLVANLLLNLDETLCKN